MKPVPDRKKLRREYLRSRTYLWITSSTASGVFVLMLMAMILFLLLSIGCVMHAWRSGSTWLDWFWCGIYVALALTSGRAAYHSCFWREEAEHAARLPGVPPFNVEALPAEEILMRGAAAPPVAQSSELLRAAQGQETPQEELLRITDNAK